MDVSGPAHLVFCIDAPDLRVPAQSRLTRAELHGHGPETERLSSNQWHQVRDFQPGANYGCCLDHTNGTTDPTSARCFGLALMRADACQIGSASCRGRV